MYVRVVVYLLTLWFFVVQISEAADNPNDWPKKYPGCAGKKQSPIAITTKQTTKLQEGPINFLNYNHPVDTLANNNGHTITIPISAKSKETRPLIQGGGLTAVYEVHSFHFHWGSPNSKGAEHSIDGKRLDMEMHVIHKNEKFDTLPKALGVPGGVVVLGFLFEKTTANANSKGLNAVCDILPSMVKYGSNGTLPKDFTMKSIVNTERLDSFYKYDGSLTTPPCTENITWVVSPEIQKVSSDCLGKFFKIMDESNHALVNNFRPVQPLNGRTVYFRNTK